MLLHGGFDGSSDTTAAVGHEVVAALEAVGLPVEWNRGPGRAITFLEGRGLGWGGHVRGSRSLTGTVGCGSTGIYPMGSGTVAAGDRRSTSMR